MTEPSEKNDPDILLKKLPGTSGLNRIRILADLTVAFRAINPEKAIEFGKQGLELLQDTEDLDIESVILNELCWAYQCTGEYSTSLDCGSKALVLTDETNDEQCKSTAFNRIGATYARMGKFDLALECFMKSLRIQEKIGDKLGIAGLYSNIGSICYTTGDCGKALDYYNKAIRIFLELNAMSNLAVSYNNAGNIYSSSAEYMKALDYYKEALEIREKLGEIRGVSHSLFNIGSVFRDLKDYDKSLEYFFRALGIEMETCDRHASVETLHNIGRTYALTDQCAEAFDYAQRGLAIAEELDVPDLKKNCFETMSIILEQKGDFREALEYHKKYKELFDTIFSEESSQKYNELQVNYETEKKEKENEIYRLRNIELVKANEELKKALAEVKTLSGLLPICSSCKKIRDDGGYWEQIEGYISKRSDAQFSHGICPECAKKIYPEYTSSND